MSLIKAYRGGAPTFISLFSGVGGFDLGLERAGWECVGQCDNDPFCNKVLAKHWPGVKRYDDVRNVGLREPLCEERAGGTVPDSAAVEGAERDGRAGRRSTVDLICGGFPCQDLSVAGKRAGLDGARSGLWFEFHRILSELRPTFALIENVPGLLSSDSGRDFGIVLGGLGELWPAVGWAVLDSQHFGVAQRRRRVYVVAGPSRSSVQQILSLCEGGDWNTQARPPKGEDVAATIRGRSANPGVNEPGRGGEDDSNLVVSGTLAPGAHPGGFNGRDAENGMLVAHPLRADGFDASEDGTGRGTPLVVRTAQTGANGIGVQDDMAYTLDGTDGQAVGYTIHGTDKTARVASQTDVAGSIRTKPPGSQENSSKTVALQAMGVRRLTPIECARLQGFPDRWTCLCDKEVCTCSDGPQYKAYGNAVTVPVIEYIGRRMREVLP